jgi:dTDP-4-dehydrorhamnose reductase
VTVLVTGARGQLGTHLADRLHAEGVPFVALASDELDVTSADAVHDAVSRHRPDVVINAAAYTAVDAAERDEERAARVNAAGPAHLAAALARHGGRLIHVSTDYVFDGMATRAYEPDDPTGPRTAYGRTKLAGEQAARSAHNDVVIVRTAWVYGGPSPNFVDTMRRLATERETVDVVADQIGSPTYVADLAAGLVELTRAPVRPATLHFVNAGTASWCDLARETFRLLGADPARVHPVTSAEFVRPARRPAWSVLSTHSWVAAGLRAPRTWQDALAEYLRQA